MVGKLQRDPSTGKLLRDAVTGKLMRTVEGIACVYCWGHSTPAMLQLTLSGLLECNLCKVDGYGGSRKIEWLIDPNNDWILTQHLVQPCLWYQNVENMLRESYYENEDCSSEPGETIDLDVLFKVTRGAGGMQIRAECLDEDAWSTWDVFISGLLVEFEDCVTVSNVPNAIDICEWGMYAPAAYDGVANVVEL